MSTPTGPALIAGRYRLVERIGAGSMGTVWRGTDEVLGRTVAVKQLLLAPGVAGSPEGAEFQEARQRILREGRLAARLQHPNAVVVFDVVLHDDLPFLVMEYVPSRTLAAVVAAEGRLDPRRAAAIGARVADGLAAAHAAGIVHRDIKPANVLIGDDGSVKITDFGVSRAQDDVQLTRAGMIAGTPAYLAPEVARGQTPTPASDIFALGSTLYACVEGEPPFGLGENTYALLYAVGAGEVRPPTRAGALTSALMSMLDKDPARRPAATRARDELTALAARAPAAPAPAAPAPSSASAGFAAPAGHSAPAGYSGPAGPPAPEAGRGRADVPAGGYPPAAAGPPSLPGATRYSASGTRVDLGPREGSGPPPGGPGYWGPPAAPPPGPSRARGGIRWVGLAVAVLLVVAGLAFAIGGRDLLGGAGPVPPAVPPAAPRTPGSPQQAAPSETESPAPRPTANAEQLEAFIRDYYGLLPGDTDQAWQLLGEQAREASGGEEQYRDFYSTVSSISFAEGPTAVDERTVRARLVFESTDGSTGAPEPYEFVVEPDSDGNLRLVSFSQG